ncbi:Lysosome membrane protein [Schistosoma japonicum]|uniref:Scavenger receptor class B member 1 n=1 Tax=Schistosoma japonicum TaxID=6182 RepID=A0A4Z2DFD5_SCHJA|nr:Lysosome membrane protein [Schistosoma japonicum]
MNNIMLIRILITLIIISFIILCSIHPFLWLLINHEMKLTPGTKLYTNWLQSSIPIIIQFYFFNLTNPFEFENGAKPILKQIGPYTYSMTYFKVNIKHNYINGTIQYNERKLYYFNRTLSIGNEFDIINHINIGYLSVAMHMNSSLWLIDYFIEFIEKHQQYRLFTKKTIKQLLWGYHDEFLIFLSKLGIIIPTTEIGILLHHNNTLSNTILINDGLHNQKRLGEILQYNGSKQLNYWQTLIANMINGTDGTIYHTYMSTYDKPYIFIYDLCRSIQLNWYSFSQLNNLPVYKYILSEDIFKSGKDYVINKGFCINWPNCYHDGVLDMSTCQMNSPIVISQPHFINADKTYQDAVEGIQPTNEEYNTTIYLEPTTGLIISAQSKLQINLVIRNTKKFQQLSHIPNVLLPLVFFNESVNLNASTINELNMKLNRIPSIMYFISIFSIIFNVLLLCIIMMKSYIQNKCYQQVNEENEPLLRNH